MAKFRYYYHTTPLISMKQKIALITGCSSGFGYLTALKFSREGIYTFASVRNLRSAGIKQLVKSAKIENLPLEIIKLDVTNENSIKTAVKTIYKKKKGIDILVNNAGFGTLGPTEMFTIEEIKNQFETNVYGLLRVTKIVAPIMRNQKNGLIINVSSIAGLVPFPLFGVYSASKFAIETLTETLRFELSQFGIKVTAVEPGSYKTNFTQNRMHPKAMESKEYKNSPYQKLISNFFSRYKKTHDKDRKILSKVANPQEVADKIYQITKLKRPAPRYLIGQDAKFYTFLKYFLPWQVWEFLLRKAYHY